MKTTTTRIQHPGARTAATCSLLTLVLCLLLMFFPRPSHAAITPTGDVAPANPGTWTSGTDGYIGNTGVGMLDISDESDLFNSSGYIGFASHSTGVVTVDGAGATWTNSHELNVGNVGHGTLNITGGGTVSNVDGYIGRHFHSVSVVTVDGVDSKWENSNALFVGYSGDGALNITGGGLVIAADLYIGGDDSINMATGGMLAINGKADNSLEEFMGLVDGSDTIRYWNDSTGDWANITGATEDVDYTLNYLNTSDLPGYTMLTVETVPEPSSFVGLLVLSLAGLLARRRRKV